MHHHTFSLAERVGSWCRWEGGAGGKAVQLERRCRWEGGAGGKAVQVGK